MKFKELQLFTSNFEEQKEFYSSLLKTPVISESDKSIEYHFGRTILKFIKSEFSRPYHFAINIPSNKIEEAHHWLKSRVKILSYEGNELIDFKSWNAKSLYFYDADKNIVELIARKNLNYISNKDFSPNSFIEISEIGTPVRDIKNNFLTLNKTLSAEIFDGNFEKFCAVGDETGLFILIDRDSKKWFPVFDSAYFSDYQILVEQDNKDFNVLYIDGTLSIIA